MQLEFLEAAAHSCVFTGIYVFAMELLSAKYRVLGSMLVAIGGSVGNLLFGIAVMYVHDFRVVLRIFNIPGLFVFFYFLIQSESVRWLLATGRIDRAIDTMKRIAKFNRRELSEKTIQMIRLKYSTNTSAQQKSQNTNENQSVLHAFWTIFKTRSLCFRFINGSAQWIACCFSFYGLYQFTTQIPGVDRYISYLIIISTEAPMDLVQLTFNRMKRRMVLSAAFFLAGICIFITSLVSREWPWTVVLCFLIGKSLLGFTFTAMYMYTAEQYPTNIRTTVLNTQSMFARCGSMLAPYAVILVRFPFVSIPFANVISFLLFVCLFIFS